MKKRSVGLRMTENQHSELLQHLFPGDGLEAIAWLLCGRRAGDSRHVLLAREVIPVPYEECSVRTPEKVTWNTSVLDSLIARAYKENLALVKVHSHPTGSPEFSTWDDESDRMVFNAINQSLSRTELHASVILLADGSLQGRVIEHGLPTVELSFIQTTGQVIRYWNPNQELRNGDVVQRHLQAFGQKTTQLLQGLSIAVVGCSGTGSMVVEQLARLGVGKLVLVDPDKVEKKNLNRILNTTWNDAEQAIPKVHVLRRFIESLGLNQEVETFDSNLQNKNVIDTVAECDVVFGCMDTHRGRQILNRLSSFYLIPYFDVGVKLDPKVSGGISTISGGVHYLTPDGSTLLDRGVINMQIAEDEALHDNDPAEYRARKANGYIRGIAEDSPAVISINMLYSSLAVLELLNRLHWFRNKGPDNSNWVGGNLCDPWIAAESNCTHEAHCVDFFGLGDTEPRLLRRDIK